MYLISLILNFNKQRSSVYGVSQKGRSRGNRPYSFFLASAAFHRANLSLSDLCNNFSMLSSTSCLLLGPVVLRRLIFKGNICSISLIVMGLGDSSGSSGCLAAPRRSSISLRESCSISLCNCSSSPGYSSTHTCFILFKIDRTFSIDSVSTFSFGCFDTLPVPDGFFCGDMAGLRLVPLPMFLAAPNLYCFYITSIRMFYT